MSRYYPMMVSLEGSRCLVVGGGAVGARRTGGLLEAGADVTLICPEIRSPLLREWKEAGAIRHLPKAFAADDLDGAALVIAATGEDELNGWICDEARRRGIPANSASDAARGSFIVPATVRRGGLLLTVTASGAGPALAAAIADELRARYGPEYGELTKRLAAVRAQIKAAVGDAAERRRLLRAAAGEPGLRLWREAEALPEPDALLRLLREWADDADAAEPAAEAEGER